MTPADETQDDWTAQTVDAARSGRAETSGRTGIVRRLWSFVREIVVVSLLALVLSLVVKTWLAQAFYIPSGSMEDTLLVGDRVLVSKLTPDLVPLERGDIVVFEDPGGWLPPQTPASRGRLLDAVHEGLVFVGLVPASEDHLIKRVIGLPGDRISCCGVDGRLVVNGVAIDERPYLKPGDQASSMTFDITVPAGHVWVMGDHRSDSEDSRFHDPNGDGKGGSVAIDHVTGRAIVRLWPVDRLGGLGSDPSVYTSVPGASTTSPTGAP